MANSERSFIDRHQKSVSLVSAAIGFSPAFAPFDNSLTTVNFSTTLTAVATANTAVGTARTDFSNAVQTRLALVQGVPKLTTRIVNYVKSNPSWKVQFPRIKELGDKVRKIKPPLKTATPPAPQPGQPTPPPEKPRDRGDGSYAEIAENFKLLVAALNALPGYAPADPEITLATLTALGTQMEANNLTVGAADTALDTAQRTRYALYYDEGTGLADKFAAFKQEVKGQYGQSSTQYAQVKGIKW